MSSIPGPFAWILVLLLAVIMVPFGFRPPPAMAPPSPPAVHVVTVEARIPAEGHDRHQRSLPFTVYVLSQELSWKLESTTDLEGGQTILSPELIAAVNRARDLFCVGTASFEGATRAEEARAAQRADRLAHWISGILASPRQTRVFTLNAGQYQGPAELLSAYQRKAILFATGPHADEVDLGEGLASGLEQQQRNFPVVYSLLHHYSRSGQWLKFPSTRRRAPPPPGSNN